MIDAIQSLQQLGKLSGGAHAQPAPASDVSFFQQQLGMEPSGNVNSSVKSFVERAQAEVDQSKVQIDKQLRSFNAQNNVVSLVEAMHASAMKSVSIQLTGKIGSKVSEGFEQLVKQQ